MAIPLGPRMSYENNLDGHARHGRLLIANCVAIELEKFTGTILNNNTYFIDTLF